MTLNLDLENLRKTDPDYMNPENHEEHDVAYVDVLREPNMDLSYLEIDWSKLAEPQADEYDIKSIKKVREVLFDKKNVHLEEGEGDIFNGRVKLFDYENAFNPPRMKYVTKTDVEELYWDKIVRMQEIFYDYASVYIPTIENLVDYYQPFLVLSEDGSVLMWEGLGCSCGVIKNAWDDKVVLTSSLNTSIGAVDGLIHESFHDRLRSLGVSLVRHTGHLIANPPGLLYSSPIRTDIKRPIAAVVQAQYSYIGVNDFYQNILLNIEKFPETNISAVKSYLKELVSKIEFGLQTINAHLIPTEGIGEAFFEGFLRYNHRIIQEVNETLNSVK